MDNVYLPSGKEIAVSKLTVGARIGVTPRTTPTSSTPVTFAAGAAAGDETFFFSDNSGCHVRKDGMFWPALIEGGRAELLCPAFILEKYRERVAKETGKPCPGLFLSVILSPRMSSSTAFAEILEEELNGHQQ